MWKKTFPSEPSLTPLDALQDDQRLKVQLVGLLVLDAFEGGDWPLARQNWKEADLDNDERAACWGYFDSRQRAYLKGDERKYLIDN